MLSPSLGWSDSVATSCGSARSKSGPGRGKRLQPPWHLTLASRSRCGAGPAVPAWSVAALTEAS